MRASVDRPVSVDIRRQARRSSLSNALPPIRLGSSDQPIYIADAVVSAVLIAAVIGLINRYAGTSF